MTSKHFEAFARAIATITNETDAALVSKTVTGVAKGLNPRFNEDRFKDRVTELRAWYDARRAVVEGSLTFEQRKEFMYNDLWDQGHQELVEALGERILADDPQLKETQEFFDTLDEEEQGWALKAIDGK